MLSIAIHLKLVLVSLGTGSGWERLACLFLDHIEHLCVQVVENAGEEAAQR